MDAGRREIPDAVQIFCPEIEAVLWANEVEQVHFAAVMFACFTILSWPRPFSAVLQWT
jgi:hypothetical protein